MTRRAPRLVVRIYLFTVLATVAAIASVLLVVNASRSPPPAGPGGLDEHMIADLTAPPLPPGERLAELARRAARIEAETHARFTLYGTDGRLLHAGHQRPPGPLTSAELARLDAPGPPPRGRRRGDEPRLYPIRVDGRPIAYAYLSHEGFGPPPSLLAAIGVVLLVLLVSSVVFARRLARPLETIEATTRALGRGDLDARTHLSRGDEIGAVARALDGMADRIAALMRSQRELMANVSHELRTPMARIRVALDLASEGDAETAREVLADIDQDLREIERLLEDVMTSARLDLRDPTSPPLRLEDVDLGELLDRAVRRFRAQHDTHPIALDAGLSLVIDADPALLRRAVDNLLDNARKYSDATSTIHLRARQDGDSAVVEVADRGIGIEAADLGEVFRPFFRTDRSRARQTGGVGLGLSLSKQIVEAHGGRISITSAPGVGTTVTVALPLRTDAARSAVAAQPAGDAGDAGDAAPSAPAAAAARSSSG